MANIFYDSDNQLPIKFFLQKNLPQEELTQLEQLIVENGGRVQPKIPFQGYILIDPESREGLRLKTCWMGPENPRRYFVPYTFVRQCIAAKRLLPQVFRTENGSSRKLYIHTSVTNEDVRRRLTGRIQHSGGELVVAKDDAEIIIADERWDGFEALSIYHADEQSKAVEGIPWVKRSVGLGELHFSVVKKKNVGGRITGSKRTEFTRVDDNHLARYIASKLPNPEMRGRTGNKLYKDLCDASETYPWASRHPWQSWRERYRNNIDRFNNLIATFIEYDSDAEQPRTTKCESEPEQARKKTSSPAKAGSNKESSPRKGSEAPKEEDDSQWPIKVGTLGPPTWANTGKRQRSVEEQEAPEGSSKRPKTTETEATPDDASNTRSPNAEDQTPIMNESQEGRPHDRRGTTLSSDTEDDTQILGQETQAFLETNRRLVNEVLTFEKDFKPALAKIATRYHFLQDEVERTFEEFGQNLQATEQHFKDIREYIERKKLTR